MYQSIFTFYYHVIKYNIYNQRYSISKGNMISMYTTYTDITYEGFQKRIINKTAWLVYFLMYNGIFVCHQECRVTCLL